MKLIISKFGREFLIAGQLILICFLLFRSCGNKQPSLAVNLKTIGDYQKDSQVFVKELNKKSQEISTQQQNLISKDNEIQKQMLINSNLKELNEQIKIQNKTSLASIQVNYKDSVRFVIDTQKVLVDNKYVEQIDTGIKIGEKFEKLNKWFTFKGTIEKNDVRIDSLSIFNSYQITIGKKLGGKTYVELINENPYTKTITLDNIKVIEEKKWYNSFWLKFGLGFAVGFATNHYLGK